MNYEQSLKLINLLRGVLHNYCPYEKEMSYKLLEELRALETEITLSKDGQPHG